MSKAIDDVIAERKRQQDEEGWSADHDDDHKDGSLSIAAACYALNHEPTVMVLNMEACDLDGPLEGLGYEIDNMLEDAEGWPWNSHWDKRDKHDLRRSMVIAAALLVADIERLDREEAMKKDQKDV